MGSSAATRTDPLTSSPRPWVEIVSTPSGSISVWTVSPPSSVTSRSPVISTTDSADTSAPSVS